MNNSKHTPGPWAWVNCGGYTLLGMHGNRPVILSASSHNRTPYIATRSECGLLERITPIHADARLIAAAPEMFALLKTAISEDTGDGFDTLIADLIAKIEGPEVASVKERTDG